MMRPSFLLFLFMMDLFKAVLRQRTYKCIMSLRSLLHCGASAQIPEKYQDNWNIQSSFY